MNKSFTSGMIASRITSRIVHGIRRKIKSSNGSHSAGLSWPPSILKILCRDQPAVAFFPTRYYSVSNTLFQQLETKPGKDASEKLVLLQDRSQKPYSRWTLEEDNMVYNFALEGKRGYEIHQSFPHRTLGAVVTRLSYVRNTRIIPLGTDRRIKSLSTICSATTGARKARSAKIERRLREGEGPDKNMKDPNERLLRVRRIEQEQRLDNAERLQHPRNIPIEVFKPKRPWTDKEDAMLCQLVRDNINDPRLWSKVSGAVAKDKDGYISTLNRSGSVCKRRWEILFRTETTRTGRWSIEERQKLFEALREQIGDEFQLVLDIGSQFVAADLPPASKLDSTTGEPPAKAIHGASMSGSKAPEDARPALVLGGPVLRRVDWGMIAESVGTRDVEQCRVRFYATHNGRRGPWYEDECQRLKEGYQKYGSWWRAVFMYVGTRSPRQVEIKARKLVENREK